MHDPDERRCPTCLRKLPGRPRTVRRPIAPGAATGVYVGPALAGQILGMSAAEIRRLDRDLQPQRSTAGTRMYDRGKVEALRASGCLRPAPKPDLTAEWLSLRAVAELTGLQEQSLRDADARLRPMRTPRPNGKPGPRRYHRSKVLEEMVRLGKVEAKSVDPALAIAFGPRFGAAPTAQE